MKFFMRKLAAVASVVLLFASSGLMAPDAEAGNRNRGNRGHTRTSVNRNVNHNRNTNVNRNVNRNTNVNVNVDHRGGGYGHHHHGYHPVGTAVAVTAAATITAAVVGSIVYSLPPSCSMVRVGAVTYQQCGSTWYQPQYVGSNVQYVVVTSPY